MATLKTKIKIRRDTAANLANVVLEASEPAYATDTKKFAIGDGSTKFSDLKGRVIGPNTSTDNALVRFDGTSGQIIQNSNATIDDNGIIKAAGFGDGTITIKPQSSNEVNFGGTNTDTTIYFGHRATDSRPKPTLYVFGGTAADASIQANKFIKTSSSDNYVLLGGGGHKAISDFALDSEIPDPTDYYWANVKVSTSSSTSTKPTFANNFLVNIATNNVLTPGAD